MTTFSVEIIYYLKILFEIIVPVLSSNSEPFLKTGLVFAYELRFRYSIYQNQLEKKIRIRPSSALSGSENFKLVKNWSQDHVFKVTRFLSILSKSSEISTGHVFLLFELIFSVVTSFVLLSKRKISKNKIKKSKFSKKTTTAQKIEKRGAKEEQYLKEHIEKAKVSCVSVCYLVPCSCCSCYPPYLFVTHLALGTF